VTTVGIVGVGVGAVLWWRSGRGRASSRQADARLRVEPVVGRDTLGLMVRGGL
jgi:hypothetical protein